MTLFLLKLFGMLRKRLEQDWIGAIQILIIIIIIIIIIIYSLFYVMLRGCLNDGSLLVS